ncbi:glycine cleavage system H protein [Sulfurivirga caldicuralii]|uniref:Glycine cleavage system H protein n=1 Tax=Sulfurivirga caldicuralii TaxID=364032 RepID=A0A1N6DRN1_9GAMM|nr:glycine cleavage system protein GcvH [Sulfurivirga caldicuralii]SIN73357.1 glycine cleavage system H protein [Sulfurivirga caldicuralii]
MSNLPAHLKYAETHEWAWLDENGEVVVGITDHAQEALGDIMHVDLPEVGDIVRAGDAVAVIESVKTASDIHAPVDGEIVAINEALEDEPERVNDEPYDGGWLFRIQPADASQLDELLSPEAYATATTE